MQATRMVADKRQNPSTSAFAEGDPFDPRSNIASQMKIFVFIVFFVVNFFNHRGYKVHKEYHKDNLCGLCVFAVKKLTTSRCCTLFLLNADDADASNADGPGYLG